VERASGGEAAGGRPGAATATLLPNGKMLAIRRLTIKRTGRRPATKESNVIIVLVLTVHSPAPVLGGHLSVTLFQKKKAAGIAKKCA